MKRFTADGVMKCVYARCWRLADVYIPGTDWSYCSAHAFVLGTWPMRRLRELETTFKDSRRRPSGLAA